MYVCEYFRKKSAGEIFCHREIHIQIVAAVFGGCSRNITLKRSDEREHFFHQGDDVAGCIISCEKKVESCPAAHGSEIDYLILISFVISQKSSAQMFNRMDFCGIHDRFIVWTCHADIKCSNDRTVHIILSGDIDARFQANMVNGKTCDFFHNDLLPFSVICPVYYSFSGGKIQGLPCACRAGILEWNYGPPVGIGGTFMLLYIVRHGETDWNKSHRVQGRTDIPLNDYGRRLAEETAEGMKDIQIDIGMTSPLLRAKETAQIILKGRDVPLYDEARLQEISFGRYEGVYCGGDHCDPESEAFNRFFCDTGNYIPPDDAETIPQLYERTGGFLESLMRREDLAGKSILVSTHGAAMTSLLNRIRGNLSVEHFWRDEVPPNCSVTVVEINGSKAQIVKEGLIFYKEKVKKWKTV